MRRKSIITARPPRGGSILILSALMLTMVFGFVAFSVDVGYIAVTKARLQNAADAAALAAAGEMLAIRTGSLTSSYQAAQQMASANSTGGQEVQLIPNQDIEFGEWDEALREFQPLSAANLDRADVVRVTCSLLPERGNQLQLFFAPILGMRETSVSAVAVARFEGGSIFPLALRSADFADDDIDNMEDDKDDEEDFDDDSDDDDPKDDDEDNPHKLAPSKPKNGKHFEIGEEVILGYDDDDDDDNDHEEVTLRTKHEEDDFEDDEVINGEKEKRGEKIKKLKHKEKHKNKKKKKHKEGREYDKAKKRIDSNPSDHRLRDVSVPIVRPDESTRDPVTKKVHDLEIVDVVRVHLEGKKLVSVTDPITGDIDVLEVIYGTVTGISKKSDPAGVGVGLKPLRRIKLVQ